MELIFNNLEVVWFILITVLFAGFFLLEGFDYGTGILLPFIGKTDVERRQMINALGPCLGWQRGMDDYCRWCIICILPSCICYIV